MSLDNTLNEFIITSYTNEYIINQDHDSRFEEYPARHQNSAYHEWYICDTCDTNLYYGTTELMEAIGFLTSTRFIENIDAHNIVSWILLGTPTVAGFDAQLIEIEDMYHYYCKNIGYMNFNKEPRLVALFVSIKNCEESLHLIKPFVNYDVHYIITQMVCDLDWAFSCC